MEFQLPARLSLANLPTPIQRLERTSERVGRELWIKRDDCTGLELSGNKIRKLEFALAQAMAQGCDVIITTGGIQSNHCRATAAACARLGLGCELVLASDEKTEPDGNYLLDELLGARIRFIPFTDYRSRLAEVLEEVKAELAQRGQRGYIIPVGASNGIGTWGYFEAMREIHGQEEAMGATFDAVVCAVGSGGTYAGLALANAALGLGKRVIGVPIAADAATFREQILGIREEFSLISAPVELDASDIILLDGYVGRGYALSTAEELSFLKDFARTEGIILDPVYTGKAMRGLLSELEAENPLLAGLERVLFIHTGGIFGLFPKRHQF